MRWNISRHHAASAYGAVVSNGDARKNYRVRANPHVIFNDNRCGRWRNVSLFEAMLVPIDDAQVVTK